MADHVASFSIGDDKEIKFSSYPKLRNWLENERDAWLWLGEDQFGTNFHSSAKNTITSLINQSIQLEENHENQQLKNQLVSHLNTLQNLIRSGQFVPSATSFGKFVLDLAKSDVESAADTLRVAATPRNQALPNDSGAQNGSFLFSLFRHGLGKRSLQANQQSISDTLKDIQSAKSNFDVAVDVRIAELDEIILAREKKVDQSTKSLAKLLADFRRNLRQEQLEIRQETKENTDEFLSTSKSEIDVFSKTLKDEMALQAPIEYWKNKRLWHRVGTALAASAFLVLLGLYFWQLFSFVKSFDGGILSFWERASSLGFSGLGVIAIVVAIALVLARVLYRLFASQLHLWNDASERVTMIQTYLALAERGHNKDEFMGALINRLFAPASDGVVKDDLGSVGPVDYFVKQAGKSNQ